jgi:glycosyltransferase involved in cell wall biosynthesis
MLRLFRWTGYAKADELKQTQQVLTQSGFPQEAVALDLMFGAGAHSPEQSTEYLKQRLGRRAAATDNPCYILDDRRANKGAKAGIVVSLYKAASKLPFFMRSLNNVRLCSKAPFEVLFIDSGSPQDELAAYKAAVAETRLECLYARTDQRETIQAAWNRGLGLSRAPYVTFLGVDEMLRPDALDTLVRILDAEPGIDWVQGHGVITAVDKNGAYDRDVMPYSRTAPSKYYHYLDCTYLSYVGGLYRRSIHERLGYYDPSFRAAGDTEFKNRITPHINLKTVPETLGWFLDYPESRASQSATAEIEDVRAWYLYKSPGGIRYAYEKAAPNVVAEMLRAALGFRRTFSTLQATDVDYAKLLGEFYDEMFECRLADVQDLHRVAGILRQVYRCVDDLGEFGSGDAIFSACTAALDRLSSQYRCMVACEWLLESSVSESCDWHFWFGNDLRMLQHSNAWKPRFLA